MQPGPALQAARALQAATGEVQQQLAAKIVEQALTGCLQSQRLLVERFLPQVRAQTLAQPLPGIESGSVEQRLQVVLMAASQGTISSDEASVLVGAIRGATEAASIASAERELIAIREMRQQALPAAQGALPVVEVLPGVPRDV